MENERTIFGKRRLSRMLFGYHQMWLGNIVDFVVVRGQSIQISAIISNLVNFEGSLIRALGKRGSVRLRIAEIYVGQTHGAHKLYRL